MKKLAEQGFDDHPADDEERSRVAWTVVTFDDCDGCADIRIELTLEEEGRPGTGVSAHLAPATARLLRAGLARALREVGEEPGP